MFPPSFRRTIVLCIGVLKILTFYTFFNQWNHNIKFRLVYFLPCMSVRRKAGRNLNLSGPKVQTFWEAHKIFRNLSHALYIYLVNVQTMRKIFSDFVCFSESPNFKRHFDKSNFEEALWKFLKKLDEIFSKRIIV